MIGFNKSFYEAEERNGFMIESLMKHCWASQIEILHMVDQICKENDIRYFADWGTLLGAVRHQGYIPWDDDMDICMLRPDYEKFLRVMEENIYGIKCFNIYNTPDWGEHATRVTNIHGFDVSRKFLQRYHGCPFATGLDVFAVDYVPRDKMLEKEMVLVINLIMHALHLKSDIETCNSAEAGDKIKEYRETIQFIEETCHMKFSGPNPSNQELLILREEVSGLYGEDESDYVTAMHRLLNGQAYYVSKDAYASCIMSKFENIQIPIPVGYDEILTAKYGDYMVMRNVGGGHGYPYYGTMIEAISKLNHHKDVHETEGYIKRVCTDYYLMVQKRSCQSNIEFDEASTCDAKNKARLEVLYEIQRICQRHHIAYYLHGNTLRKVMEQEGAFAEDDTFEVAMFRSEYMRFLKVIQEELDVWFDYSCIYTNSNHNDFTTHILTDYSTGHEEEHAERFHGCREEVYVTIKPLDYVVAEHNKWELQNTIIQNLLTLSKMLPDKPPYAEEELAVVKQWEDILGVSIDKEGHLPHEIIKVIDQVCSMYQSEEEQVAVIMDVIQGEATPVDKNWYDASVEIVMESVKLNVPIGYREIISSN